MSEPGYECNSRRVDFSCISRVGVILVLFSCLRAPRLDGARQFLLAFQLHHGVVAGLAERRVPGDFAGFDGAPAFLLPHCDVGASKRMQAEVRENPNPHPVRRS